CFLCGEEHSAAKMRDHVAEHIQRKRMNVPEDLLHENPCGHCGRSDSACKSLLRKEGRKKTWSPFLDCPNFYKYSLGAAAKSTSSGPSTNRLIFCDLC
ncbi:hypothetical protein SCHPADRAFT_791853, partial [Schizopora paradoxa]